VSGRAKRIRGSKAFVPQSVLACHRLPRLRAVNVHDADVRSRYFGLTADSQFQFRVAQDDTRRAEASLLREQSPGKPRPELDCTPDHDDESADGEHVTEDRNPGLAGFFAQKQGSKCRTKAKHRSHHVQPIHPLHS